ncbi:hypothetical protein FOWG_17972 [Fusarium oxysporum f. sp. lycopersici MN25]|nr:hypothetical protein FOWG_17972 [Fusarium oxysporum f. sp. lycopersici MN25]
MTARSSDNGSDWPDLSARSLAPLEYRRRLKVVVEAIVGHHPLVHTVFGGLIHQKTPIASSALLL